MAGFFIQKIVLYKFCLFDKNNGQYITPQQLLINCYNGVKLQQETEHQVFVEFVEFDPDFNDGEYVLYYRLETNKELTERIKPEIERLEKLQKGE